MSLFKCGSNYFQVLEVRAPLRVQVEIWTKEKKSPSLILPSGYL